MISAERILVPTPKFNTDVVHLHRHCGHEECDDDPKHARACFDLAHATPIATCGIGKRTALIPAPIEFAQRFARKIQTDIEKRARGKHRRRIVQQHWQGTRLGSCITVGGKPYIITNVTDMAGDQVFQTTRTTFNGQYHVYLEELPAALQPFPYGGWKDLQGWGWGGREVTLCARCWSIEDKRLAARTQRLAAEARAYQGQEPKQSATP